MAKIGMHFPQAEIDNDFAVIRDFAQSTEEHGFSHINVPDHVLQTRTARADFPAAARYTTDFPHHEVMVLLGYLAGVTQNILLKTAVVILPQRQAVLVAKQAAELDVLSGGRLQLGVGLGWNNPEYVALNMNFRNRGKRMEEQIDVCRQLWTEQHSSFNGQWHTFDDAGLAPMPIQQPIPVWIGAFTEPAIMRAARIADGWQAMLPKPDDQAAAAFNKFKNAIKKADRNPDHVGIEATIFATGDDPESWVTEANAWLAIGATQIVFRPQGDFAYVQNAVAKFAPMINEIG